MDTDFSVEGACSPLHTLSRARATCILHRMNGSMVCRAGTFFYYGGHGYPRFLLPLWQPYPENVDGKLFAEEVLLCFGSYGIVEDGEIRTLRTLHARATHSPFQLRLKFLSCYTHKLCFIILQPLEAWCDGCLKSNVSV